MLSRERVLLQPPAHSSTAVLWTRARTKQPKAKLLLWKVFYAIANSSKTSKPNLNPKNYLLIPAWVSMEPMLGVMTKECLLHHETQAETEQSYDTRFFRGIRFSYSPFWLRRDWPLPFKSEIVTNLACSHCESSRSKGRQFRLNMSLYLLQACILQTKSTDMTLLINPRPRNFGPL
jgi:hypothetical protein